MNFFTHLFEHLFGKQTVDTIIGDIDRKVEQLRKHSNKHDDLATAASEAALFHENEALRADRIADRFAAITD